MGFFNRVFGKSAAQQPRARGHFRTCDIDGKPIQVMQQNMAIFTDDPNRFSIGSMAGYCPQCRRYLCSDHLEFQSTTSAKTGPWTISCKSCRVPVTPGP